MRKRFVVLLIILSCIFIGCSGTFEQPGRGIADDEFEELEQNEDIFKYIPKERVVTNKHIEKINFFDTERSVGYKNEDGTYTAYIFSSPIRYSKGVSGLVDFDNRLIEIYEGKYKKKNYIYRNNKNDVFTYYPDRLTKDQGFLLENSFYDIKFGMHDKELNFTDCKKLTNIWGQENEVVTYVENNDSFSINAYTTKSGFRLEISMNNFEKEIKFWIESLDLTTKLEEGGYLLVKDSEDIQMIIRKPIVKTGSSLDAKYYLNSKLEIAVEEDKSILSILLDQDLKENLKESSKPICIDISFEVHRDKLPDSPVYSELPFLNQYLSDYSIVGNHPEFGIGKVYSRTRLYDLYEENKKNINSVMYAVYNLTDLNKNKKIMVDNVSDFWSSTSINWFKSPSSDFVLSSEKISEKGYYYFNILKHFELLKIKDIRETEENLNTGGILLHSDDEYIILASSDNSLFPVFLEFNFSELPETFI